MVTAKTQGVRVSVITLFQEEFSNPARNHFVFSYRIRIENLGEHTLQLRRRHWHIFDCSGIKREVEGEGVIGLQPILEPGESHEYVSGCNLRTSIGKMAGSFLMERVTDGEMVRVSVPDFVMIAPYRLN